MLPFSKYTKRFEYGAYVSKPNIQVVNKSKQFEDLVWKETIQTQKFVSFEKGSICQNVRQLNSIITGLQRKRRYTTL